jgi:hypothetical protein
VKHVDLASDSGAGLSYDLVTVFEWLEVRHRNLVDRHRKPPNLTSLPRRLIRDELLQVLHKLMNHYRPHGRLGLIQLSRVMSHGGRAHFFVLFSRTGWVWSALGRRKGPSSVWRLSVSKNYM